MLNVTLGSAAFLIDASLEEVLCWLRSDCLTNLLVSLLINFVRQMECDSFLHGIFVFLYPRDVNIRLTVECNSLVCLHFTRCL